MLRRAIPVLHVSSSMAAERFYCVGLGSSSDCLSPRTGA